MILAGKKILVTGVLTPASIAYAIAEHVQAEGAEIVLTSFGRAMSLTEKSARRMTKTPHILELDVTNEPDGAASMASCTPSPSPPRMRWAAGS